MNVHSVQICSNYDLQCGYYYYYYYFKMCVIQKQVLSQDNVGYLVGTIFLSFMVHIKHTITYT